MTADSRRLFSRAVAAAVLCLGIVGGCAATQRPAGTTAATPATVWQAPPIPGLADAVTSTVGDEQPTNSRAGHVLAEVRGGTVAGLAEDGSIVALPDGATVEVLHRLEELMYAGAVEDACHGPDAPNKDEAFDCVRWRDRNLLVPAGFVRTADDLSSSIEGTPFSLLEIDLGLGDCPHLTTWLLGPDGYRRHLADGTNPVSAWAGRGTLVVDDTERTCLAPLPAATDWTCHEGLVTPSFGPDGTLWLRQNDPVGAPDWHSGRMTAAKRDQSVWRVVRSRATRVLRIVVDGIDDYECQVRTLQPEPVEVAPDGRRVRVDGAWRRVR